MWKVLHCSSFPLCARRVLTYRAPPVDVLITCPFRTCLAPPSCPTFPLNVAHEGVKAFWIGLPCPSPLFVTGATLHCTKPTVPCVEIFGNLFNSHFNYSRQFPQTLIRVTGKGKVWHKKLASNLELWRILLTLSCPKKRDVGRVVACIASDSLGAMRKL